jgi:type IV pilus assembly protein PilM
MAQAFLRPWGGRPARSRTRPSLEVSMLGRQRKQRSVIGLDIGSSSVKVVEIEVRNGEPRLVRFAQAPLLPEAIVDSEIIDRQAVIEAIQNLFEREGIKTKDVTTAVSGRAVIVKKIWMDRLDQEDARSAVQWEAEQHIPYDINEVTLDFQILKSEPSAKQMEVLLVAAKKDMVLGHADLVREAGLNPEIIDVDSFALQNAVLANYDFSDHEVAALVNVGSEKTNLNIVRAGIPLYTKDVPIGAGSLVEALKRKFALGEEEAQAILSGTAPVSDAEIDVQENVREVFEDLASAVERASAFLKSSGEADQVTRILLAGGGANLPGLSEFLAGRQQVRVEVVNPMARLEIDSERLDVRAWAEQAPLYSVSVGLALRKVA